MEIYKVLKVLIVLVLTVSFILALCRRRMWIVRFIFLLSVLLPSFFLPLEICFVRGLLAVGLGLLTLYLLARCINPLPRDHPEFQRSCFLLWWYLLGSVLSLRPTAYAVEGGRVKETIASTWFIERLSRTPFVGHCLRKIFPRSPVLIRSENVAILQLFVEPSRVAGNRQVFRPDVTSREGQVVKGRQERGSTMCFLKLYEEVKGAIDLRPQRKTSTFRAKTGDGMEVNLELLMDISLARCEEGKLQYYYAYNPVEVLRAFYLQGPGELEGVSWDERALSIARALLTKAISQHTLGTIYTDDHEPSSSQVLEDGLRKELKTDMNLRPFNFNLIRVTLKGVSTQAMEYALRNWEASVEIEEKPKEARAEAAYWRQVSEARFKFLQELIDKISTALQGVSKSALGFTMAMRLNSIIEDLAYSLASRGLLPSETAQTLKEIGMLRAFPPGG